MKRKHEPEKVDILNEDELKKVFDLIYRHRYKEAKELILPETLHLPLALKDPPGTLYWGDCPLLHYAVMYGDGDFIDYLLRGADINLRQQKYGYTPLYAAASRGNQKCCEFLLNRGAKINLRAKWGKTPIWIALTNGHESTLRFLLDRGADINVQDTMGWTPLHTAVTLSSISIVQLLLLSGARIVKNRDGQTPLDFANMYPLTEMAMVLENHLVTVNLSGVIARGLSDGFEFSDFLVKGVCDARLFIIIANFAYN